LQTWNLRLTTDNQAELGCVRCHRVYGRLELGTRVRR
jgi:hypothetical protein